MHARANALVETELLFAWICSLQIYLTCLHLYHLTLFIFLWCFIFPIMRTSAPVIQSWTRGGEDGAADCRYSVLLYVSYCCWIPWFLLLAGRNFPIESICWKELSYRKFCSRIRTLRKWERPLRSRSIIIQASKSSSSFLVSGNCAHHFRESNLFVRSDAVTLFTLFHGMRSFDFNW